MTGWDRLGRQWNGIYTRLVYSSGPVPRPPRKRRDSMEPSSRHSKGAFPSRSVRVTWSFVKPWFQHKFFLVSLPPFFVALSKSQKQFLVIEVGFELTTFHLLDLYCSQNLFNIRRLLWTMHSMYSVRSEMSSNYCNRRALNRRYFCMDG